MVKLDTFKAHMLHGALIQFGEDDIEELVGQYLAKFPGDASKLESLAERVMLAAAERPDHGG